ncbi:MAG: transcription antitermination factor NusB [Candidatus Omnitrophota bacterium]
MRKRTQAREFALQLLYQHELNPVPVEELLQNFQTHNPEQPPEVLQFTQELVRGTLEKKAELDPLIEKYADNWQLHRMAAIDRNILRFAVFELLCRPDIPPKVTINEAVNIAKKFSQEDSGKFVNGILDKIHHAENPKKEIPQS